MPHKTLSASVKRSGVALGLAALLLPLPGCQSVTGAAPVSQVRIIDTVPDGNGIDVYQGNQILAYNLGLGIITSYVPINPGNYAINVDQAGTHQTLASASGTFLNGAQYTVLIGSYFASLQEIILRDQVVAAPAGQISIRVLDASTRGGNIDLYLVPTGSTITAVKPFLTNINFNSNSGYINIPVGTYTLYALPAGTVPTAAGATLYTGSAVTYTTGSASTIVLIDQQLVTTPGIRVIVATDYDPAGATS